jgi:hypothetical protein
MKEWQNIDADRGYAMLRSMRDFFGHKLQATDGEIGSIKSFYFDDRYWTIRYLLAETGSWFNSKLALLSPVSFMQPGEHVKDFPVNLTRDQIKKSPEVDLHASPTGSDEALLSRYYGWPMYWNSMTPSVSPAAGGVAVAERMTYKLYSADAIFGYDIRVSDGSAGDVHDFIIDAGSWDIRYLVIDTGNWLPGKMTLLSPRWLEGVDDRRQEMRTGFSREKIKGSPVYDPSKSIDRAYEEKLFSYYGKQQYWK